MFKWLNQCVHLLLENHAPSWIFPSIQEEMEEIQRTAEDLGLPLKKLLTTIQQGVLVDLDDGLWSRMENTDSWETTDMDPAFQGQTEPCTVFAVSSYKGHYPTFKIMLKNGSLFDYIPIHALIATPNSTSDLTLAELSYGKACPDFNITVNVHLFLASAMVKGCVCFMPTRKMWRVVEKYVCTIDWFQDNHNAHLVMLNNGQFALVPNHKLLIQTSPTVERKFEPYKKLHAEWKP